jgi:hypothetical protein
MNKNNVPIFEDKTKEELDSIMTVIKDSSLPEYIKDFIIKCVESALWFPHILQQKNISLSRLKTMLFGKGYANKDQKPPKIPVEPKDPLDNKSDENVPTTPVATTQAIEELVNQVDPASAASESNNTKSASGHGRMAHDIYTNYITTVLHVENLKAGDCCPNNCGGKMYRFRPNKPRVLLRIVGQQLANVHKYVVEQFRCNWCQALISAKIPTEIGNEKYDAGFKALIVLQKYFVAVPFYRQERFQHIVGFPLSDATQWDLVEQVAGCAYKTFDALVVEAANGENINNDDTKLRIQEVIKEIKKDPDCERKGMFTTGIIAKNADHNIALFFNGTNHSGENLGALLAKRAAGKPPIIQMCDALSANIAKEIKAIICNCLSHGYRKFDELEKYFPIPCITIMKLLSQAYENDTKTTDMDPETRLKYHQEHSRPVMTMLKDYIQALMDEKIAEPNSELGNALKYMQNHWEELTKFLSVAGAHLCNNIVERALKIAIRARKSSMFYRTRYSAHIGGMLTSIIYTCELNNINAYDYLLVLQKYAPEIRINPRQWLPWNYQQNFTTTEEVKRTNQSGCAPYEDVLAVG